MTQTPLRISVLACSLLLIAGVILYPAPSVKDAPAQSSSNEDRIGDSLLAVNLQLTAQEKELASLRKEVDYSGLMAVSALVKVGEGSGSGVLVTRRIGEVNRTFVWTAAHVAAEVLREDGTFGTLMIVQEKREDGRLTGGRTAKAAVVAYSEAEDLALLEITEDDFTTASASFFLCGTIPSVGTEVIHVGSTIGINNSTSLGVVSQTDRQIEGVSFDQTSVMAYPGSSGGGVFLKDGRCIGLLTQGYGPGLNFIVPIRRMQEWAKKMEIEWALDPTIKVPTHVVRDAISIEAE